jgi:hypothetical protein
MKKTSLYILRYTSLLQLESSVLAVTLDSPLLRISITDAHAPATSCKPSGCLHQYTSQLVATNAERALCYFVHEKVMWE